MEHNSLYIVRARGKRESFADALVTRSRAGHCDAQVMEFAKNGDLYNRIKQMKVQNRFFAEDFLWKVLIMCLKGLNALHSRQIVHRVRCAASASAPGPATSART